MVLWPHAPLQETQRLIAEPVQGIQAVPEDDNARYFHVVVAGPKDVRGIAAAGRVGPSAACRASSLSLPAVPF